MRKQIPSALMVLALAGAASAQTGTLYVSDGATTSAVQGGVLQYQWDTYNHDFGYGNPTFGVAHTIKFVGRIPGQYGKEYDLSGNATGNTYYGSLQDDSISSDGASDGTHNYAVDGNNHQVYQFDTDWQSPTPLFTLQVEATHGLTWDGSNNSLWVSTYGDTTISDFAMDGTLLSSFTGDTVYNSGLALDPADGTLWAISPPGGDQYNFRQYDRSGLLLAKFNVKGVDTARTAEFSVLGAPPCYADCDGSGGLDLFDFLCYTNAFNAGDGYADCTGDGVLDLFDFLCFVNQFNAGC